jgi:hypothetical protein
MSLIRRAALCVFCVDIGATGTTEGLPDRIRLLDVTWTLCSSTCAISGFAQTLLPHLFRRCRMRWPAPTSGEASTLAIRAGHEVVWSQLGACWRPVGCRSQRCRVAKGNRPVSGQLMFSGPASVFCCQFLNWQAALDGLDQVKRLPALGAAIDRDWLPGWYYWATVYRRVWRGTVVTSFVLPVLSLPPSE